LAEDFAKGTKLTMGLWVKWVNKSAWVTWIRLSVQYKPFHTVLIRYPTWFSGSWKTSNGNRNRYFDCQYPWPIDPWL